MTLAATEWADCKLGDVLTLQRGFDLPKKDRREGEVPIVSSSGISGHHNVAKVNGPGVVTGRYGTLGEVFYVKEGFWPLNTTLYVRDFKGNDPMFVSYFLRTLDLAHQNAAGAVPGLNRNALHLLPVTVPPLLTQRKIASVLSTYDDLIETNTHRIQILEEMAQRIYREWFVNFRFPGYEKVKMVDSPLGPIPEGWEVKSIGELLSYHIGGGWGKDDKSVEYPTAAYVIRGTDIPSARHVSTDKCPLRFHKESNLASRKLHAQDIVFEVSGGSKGQPVGRSLFVGHHLLRAFDEDVMCASFCKLLRVNKESLLPQLLSLHLLRIYDNRRIERYQVQSTGISNFKFQFFLESELVPVPDLKLQARFDEIVTPLFEAIGVLGAKNSNLRRTRDLLLPKLISGEVNVDDIGIGTTEINRQQTL